METVESIKHRFQYNWKMEDGYPSIGIFPHNLSVFGTFVCGGGSTMGYKLAGYNHIGGVEIDKKVAEVYRKNHTPKHLFVEDLREFNKREDLPRELFCLDILDGSPPCSSFSLSGNREDDWGKDKVFREGQTHQVLDDLVFVYCETIERLRPRVAILENVEGIIQGNAKIYARAIKKRIESAGYKVQIFLLNAASMGVPQRRERVFFIARRKELNLPDIRFRFNEPGIRYGELPGDIGEKITDHSYSIWSKRKFGDRSFSCTNKRIIGKEKNWNSKYIYDNEVCPTILASDGSKLIEFNHPNHISEEKLKYISTFPVDYSFENIEPKYLMGMSVPPIMTAQIAYQIYLQWFKPNV